LFGWKEKPATREVARVDIHNLPPAKDGDGWVCQSCGYVIPEDFWGSRGCPKCGYAFEDLPDDYLHPPATTADQSSPEVLSEPPPPPPLLIACTALGRGIICIDQHNGRCYHDMDVATLRRDGKEEIIDIDKAITLAAGVHGFVMPVFRNTPGVTICDICNKPVVAGYCLGGCNGRPPKNDDTAASGCDS